MATPPIDETFPAAHSPVAPNALPQGDLRFSNQDVRLRPADDSQQQWINTFKNGKPIHTYLVTERAFPTLFSDFMRMGQYVGLAPALEITDALPGNVIADSDGARTRVRFSAIRQLPYTHILTVLAHEYGHAWRALNPDEPLFYGSDETSRPTSAAMPPTRRDEEREADLIGLCITRDKEGMLDWVRKGGHGRSPDYPNAAQLERDIIALQWSDCPSAAVAPSPLSVPPGAPREK